MLFTLAMLTGEEKASLRHAAALVVGSAGLIALFWPRIGGGEDAASGIGLLAIAGGTVRYCIGSIVAKPLIRAVMPFALTMVHAGLGGTALLILSLMTESLGSATLASFVSPALLGSLLFLSLLGTIVAYTFYLILLRD
jgi:drug/metabolite transporter (DMT)-like permease